MQADCIQNTWPFPFIEMTENLDFLRNVSIENVSVYSIFVWMVRPGDHRGILLLYTALQSVGMSRCQCFAIL